MASPDAAGLARVGAALAAPARAELLCALLGGTAHTGVELARHLGLSPSSVSEHVGVLRDAGLVDVSAQGRHRYFRLAGPDVADALERLGVLAMAGERAGPRLPRVAADLRFARSCYGHLAGRLGVALRTGLADAGALDVADGGPITLTASGERLLNRLGASAPAGGWPSARPCLDWSERRHHLAGPLGDALLSHLIAQRWLVRRPGRPRVLELTPTGRHQLTEQLHIEVP